MALIGNDIPGAEDWVKKGIKLYPKDERFYLLWAAIVQQQKNLDEAKHRLDEGLTALPSSLRLLDVYFNIQLQQKDFDGAKLTLKKLAGARLRPELQELDAAKLSVAEGKYREARQQLEQLRLGLTKIPQLSRDVDELLFQCYSALNQPDMALKVANNLQGGADGELKIAAALASVGKTSEALKHFEHLAAYAQQNNNPAALAPIMKTILDLRIAQQMRKPKEQRDWHSVDDLFAKMREQNQFKEPAGTLVQIKILSRKGEDEKAHEVMQQLLTQYPADSTVVGTAVDLAIQQRHPDEAQKIIDAAPAEIRSEPRFMVDRLQSLFIAGGTPEELKAGLATIAGDIEKLPAEKRLLLYPNLGQAYIQARDLESAKQLWSRAAEQQPKDPQIRLMQFDLAHNMGDLATMKQVEQWFEKDYTDDPVQTKLLQAALMVSSVQQEIREKMSANPQQQIVPDDAQSRTLVRARDLLREVNNQRPGWVQTPKWLAQIDLLENKPDEAIGDLQAVIDLGQPNTELVKTLVKLLASRHRTDEALAILEANRPLVVGDSEMDQIQAQLELSSGQPKAALERLKSRFSEDSTNPNQHLMQGELYANAGYYDEAEKEIRRSLELDPQLAGGWIDMVKLKVLQKKTDDALQILQEAQIKLPEDQRPLVLAQGYELLNDPTQAEQYFQAAVSAAPNNLPLLRQVAEFYLRSNRPGQAKKYLDQLVSSDSTKPADKDAHDWARRTTARMMANGNYQQFQKALEMLTPAGEKPNIEDLTTRISILFERGDPASSRQALRLLDELKQIRPLTWQERLILAKLDERVGDWRAAREEMLLALGSVQTRSDCLCHIHSNAVASLVRRRSFDMVATTRSTRRTRQDDAHIPGRGCPQSNGPWPSSRGSIDSVATDGATIAQRTMAVASSNCHGT